VLNIETDAHARVIVSSIVSLGHSLGLAVVAEGVETRPVWDHLAELGCDIIQGYYLSRPLAAPDFEGWLCTSPWGRTHPPHS
jgi:EAL domain-containing protein (putative c-di-GMP-specific phosphodiesterase class I)